MADARKLVGYAVLGGIAAGAYYLITRENPSKAVTKQAKAVAKAVEGVVRTTKTGLKHFVKGSPEAKAHMAKLRAMAKGKPRKKKSTAHKGHATKRGLAQDQKLDSQEPHEKAYQKRKAAGKV